MSWWKNFKKKIYNEVKNELEEEEANQPTLQRVLSAESEKYRDSKEPWVTIIGDTISDEGIQIALDWNDAFISYLKAEGVAGADETQIVQRWLAMIAKQTSDKLHHQFVDAEGNISEFR